MKNLFMSITMRVGERKELYLMWIIAVLLVSFSFGLGYVMGRDTGGKTPIIIENN